LMTYYLKSTIIGISKISGNFSLPKILLFPSPIPYEGKDRMGSGLT
jgi:hypothetical protein